jgi:hypothetical protein
MEDPGETVLDLKGVEAGAWLPLMLMAERKRPAVP